MKTLNPYPEKLIGKPIQELLNNYHQIELDIISDLMKFIRIYLLSIGFNRKDQIFVKCDLHLSLFVEFSKLRRTLYIMLKNIAGKNEYLTSTKSINHFGLIREILIEAPVNSGIIIDDLCSSLSTKIIQAYAALEQALISGNADLEMKVFRRLYDFLEAQFKHSDKIDLFGRCWFFISQIEEGFYFFNESVLRRVIDYYKLHQDEIVSPIELTVWILSAPLPFQKSLAIEGWRQKRFLSLEWMKTRYLDEANNIFKAEISLFDSKSFTSTTLFEKRGYFLIFAMPTELKEKILPEIIAIKGALEKQFEEGLKEWSPYIRSIKKISNLAEVSIASTFIGKIIGHAIKTVLTEP